MTGKTANVYASLYGGEFQIGFDCPGVETCRYALCQVMPPDGSEECTYRNHGSCVSPAAQSAAVKMLRNRLTKEMKSLEDDYAR